MRITFRRWNYAEGNGSARGWVGDGWNPGGLSSSEGLVVGCNGTAHKSEWSKSVIYSSHSFWSDAYVCSNLSCFGNVLFNISLTIPGLEKGGLKTLGS